jgi:hypothetical protein
LLLGKQILFPQQCFHGSANRETFEETSRITNVSATMFPSLPWALQTAKLRRNDVMFAIRLTLCNTSNVGTSFHKLFILFVFHQEFLCFEDLKLSIDTYDSKQTKFFIQCIYHLVYKVWRINCLSSYACTHSLKEWRFNLSFS